MKTRWYDMDAKVAFQPVEGSLGQLGQLQIEGKTEGASDETRVKVDMGRDEAQQLYYQLGEFLNEQRLQRILAA